MEGNPSIERSIGFREPPSLSDRSSSNVLLQAVGDSMSPTSEVDEIDQIEDRPDDADNEADQRRTEEEENAPRLDLSAKIVEGLDSDPLTAFPLNREPGPLEMKDLPLFGTKASSVRKTLRFR
jgi:hypothetical protein